MDVYDSNSLGKVNFTFYFLTFLRTPYFIACMYRACFDGKNMSPLAATIPGYFAKASLVLPTISSLFGNADIYSKLKKFNDNSNENVELLELKTKT